MRGIGKGEIMITEPTVFVLGAGASEPYGYPTGKQLKEQILEHFLNDFDRVFPEQVQIEPWNTSKSIARQQVPRFLETFGGPVPSIDLFLAGHPDDLWLNRLGRLAIILRISTAELEHSKRRKQKRPEKDWCEFLLGKLRGGLITPDDFKSRFRENNVTIITFNYDRFLEDYVFDGLQKSFGGLEPETVKEQLGHIKIVHVFGQIAPLPWQNLGQGIKYGSEITEVDVLSLSKNLRIIYDGYHNPELEEARTKIAETRRIFFLGFGYAGENLKVLALPKVINPIAKIWGTHLDATKKECNYAGWQLVRDMGLDWAQVRLDKDCDCLKLLREYF